jgi:hypothetical protein
MPLDATLALEVPSKLSIAQPMAMVGFQRGEKGLAIATVTLASGLIRRDAQHY